MRKSRDTDSIPNEVKVTLLRDLISLPWWSILCSHLEDEIERLDWLINTVDPKQNQVAYTQKDIHILDKQNIQNLVDAPEKIIKAIKPHMTDSVTVSDAIKDNGLIDLSFATDPTGII